MRELVALTRRVVLAAAITGVVVGAVVGVFERLIDGEMLHWVLTAPLAVQIAARLRPGGHAPPEVGGPGT